jgi:aspartate/methionine/tyrosine aminotransferase
MRALQSTYMHWAKNQRPVRFAMGSSEVTHFRLDRLGIALPDLELDGASRYRYPPLREAIAARQGVSPGRVVMADGTSMANMLALAALLAPGDELLVEHPAYEPMVAAASFLGARIRTFPRRAETGFALEPEAIEAALTPATRLILLTNLHNPTGALAEQDVLRDIGAIAARAGAHVLVDEVYLDAAATPQRSAAQLGDTFVCTASLTKVYGLSGLRCGWILAEPDLAERMWRLNELFGVAQGHASERLSLFALEHLDAIAAGTADRLAHNRALYNAFLARRPELEGLEMRHGITAFPRLLRSTPEALDALGRERFDVGIVPGAHFGAPEHLRIGIGGETEMVTEGLQRLEAALDAL